MNTNLVTINWFVDFDKEEKWLNKMARKGLAFRKVHGFFYCFGHCKPGEFIYQIDFDEKKSKNGVGDYVAFRSSCGDQLVDQQKSKIYWRRETASGPFEAENNVAAKLRLTNKAFNFHLNSFIGLTLIAAVAFLVLVPLGRHLPESALTRWLVDFGTGLTYGILLAELFLLLPALRKLNKSMNGLIGQIF